MENSKENINNNKYRTMEEYQKDVKNLTAAIRGAVHNGNKENDDIGFLAYTGFREDAQAKAHDYKCKHSIFMTNIEDAAALMVAISNLVAVAAYNEKIKEFTEGLSDENRPAGLAAIITQALAKENGDNSLSLEQAMLPVLRLSADERDCSVLYAELPNGVADKLENAEQLALGETPVVTQFKNEKDFMVTISTIVLHYCEHNNLSVEDFANELHEKLMTVDCHTEYTNTQSKESD